MKTVSVVSFATGTDSYGQRRTTVSSTRQVEMMVKDYQHTFPQDIRFAEVEKLGFTKDFTITDQNEIVVDSVQYLVKFVLPTKRYLKLYLVRK